jgi:hypothetical protein
MGIVEKLGIIRAKGVEPEWHLSFSALPLFGRFLETSDK